MSITSLEGVLKIFGGGGGDPSPEEQAQLFKEVALMTLARATAADSNINNVEVELVQSILKEKTGEEFPAADIRVAAQSEIFEKAPLEKYIKSSARKLKWQDRVTIALALSEVIKADDRITDREINFFNMISDALELSPAQLVGLAPEE